MIIINKFIKFSKPELFLIGIIAGRTPQTKIQFLTNLKKYIPGKDRIPGHCSDYFIKDVYDGLKTLDLIREYKSEKISLTKKGTLILDLLKKKCDLFNCDLDAILRDVLYSYNNKLFVIGPSILLENEILLLEQFILISNPIINLVLTILNNLKRNLYRNEFYSEEIFMYGIEYYEELMRKFIIKRNSKKNSKLTINDISSTVYDDIKNQMRNAKLVLGDYGPSKFPNDKWIIL